MKVLLTGASGFVGSALMRVLAESAVHEIRPVFRGSSRSFPRLSGAFFIEGLHPHTDWVSAASGIDVVVHAAARVHVLKERSLDPLAAFRETNVFGTLNLASQAARAGATRFIFISSIGVNGNESALPFTVTSQPQPSEPYAISKLEAERGLVELSRATGMEVVIIRPPLVYGPDAPGNFKRLAGALQKGVPLPLGAIDNQRTFIALPNLVDLIVRCIDHPAAANRTLLAGDGEDMSTTEFLRRMSAALGKRPRLVPVPVSLLEVVARLFGKRDMVRKLCCNLQVDITHTREILGWQPPLSVDEGLSYAMQPSQNLMK